MAATESTMMPLGTTAPPFKLLDTISGSHKSLKEQQGEKGTVIMFICNHCPYVKHINAELVKLANSYKDKGIGWIAISSNDIDQYPEDGPIEMKKVGEASKYPFPYLFDATQEVAKSYGAACTPDFYVFERNLKCVYRGQFDNSRPGNGINVNGFHLRTALDQLISGKNITVEQIPSVGCNIKWKQQAI